MHLKKMCISLLVSLFICQSAIASEEAPVQFSTVNFNAPNTDKVNGFHFSTLHGKTGDVKGFDMTVLGLSEMDNFSGFSLNLLLGINKVNNNFNGAALSLMNWHLGQDTGFNFAIINKTNSVKGVNMGIANLSNTVAGANIGFINHSDKFSLVDFGVMNIAKTAKFQFGIFNIAENLQGLQIGLINYAENGVVKILPLVNFRKTF